MCVLCCKEFAGWCRSFTKTETALCILQGILLVVFTVFLAFLILHLLVCSKKEQPSKLPDVEEEIGSTHSVSNDNTPATVGPGVECTWIPSQKTEAATHYYETRTVPATQTATVYFGDDFKLQMSDGEDVEDERKRMVLALVKIKPPQDVTFGCILTAVSRHWTLTAASCIEAIEEVDSLDSFVMMEGYGEPRAGRAHAVSDVRIHPQYGVNGSHDLAALRSADRLGAAAALASALDYALITIGERLDILGYGGYR